MGTCNEKNPKTNAEVLSLMTRQQKVHQSAHMMKGIGVNKIPLRINAIHTKVPKV